MNLFKNLFSHKDVEPVLDYKKAIVFVDYEHWYYSCRNLFHIAPDPITWRKSLDEKYNIINTVDVLNTIMSGLVLKPTSGDQFETNQRYSSSDTLIQLINKFIHKRHIKTY